MVESISSNPNLNYLPWSLSNFNYLIFMGKWSEEGLKKLS